ncbi:GPN [Acanthosepion pharaonis]|uniref:GPN-loop GTPase 2 n=1 Tax=Acanthosepion pharaonis TaxID=158019 RepID=A0A812E0S4_ACAPH|nr:GPN [Sepia pharaonis]
MIKTNNLEETQTKLSSHSSYQLLILSSSSHHSFLSFLFESFQYGGDNTCVYQSKCYFSENSLLTSLINQIFKTSSQQKEEMFGQVVIGPPGSAMLQVELPHVNVLSKADLIQSYGKLAFNLDFYTDVLDLTYLLDQLQDDPIFKKYKKMNAALVEIIQDYSLVSFVALNIKKNESILRVLQTVDKANGYMFGDTEERNLQSMLSCAIGAEFEYEKIKDIQEKYVMDSDHEEKMDEDESENSGEI